MKPFVSHSIEETEKIAADWLREISMKRNNADPADSSEALVVGLSGHLGAGKTAFVKAAAKALGVAEGVTSPTFVIMKLYRIGSNGGGNDPISSAVGEFAWKRLVHIDAYRLERPEELEALGFEALVADPGNLIMIEWPEMVDLKRLHQTSILRFSATENEHTIFISN